MTARLDLALKIVATLIALFGVGKYFADRAHARDLAARDRALGYIERFGSAELVATRARLLGFWRDYPEVAAVVGTRGITQREFAMFVEATYPARADRAEIDDALFRMQVFLDEMSYCRASDVCDREILDGFFCNFAQRYAKAYGPFYARLARDIGAAPIDAGLQAFAAECTPPDGA